jgi:hypothetical protein
MPCGMHEPSRPCYTSRPSTTAICVHFRRGRLMGGRELEGASTPALGMPRIAAPFRAPRTDLRAYTQVADTGSSPRPCTALMRPRSLAAQQHRPDRPAALRRRKTAAHQWAAPTRVQVEVAGVAEHRGYLAAWRPHRELGDGDRAVGGAGTIPCGSARTAARVRAVPSVRRWRGFVEPAAWSWSSRGLPGVAAPRCLDAAEEGVEAGGESLVAVVGPDVLAEGGQGGEAVGRQ